MSTVFHVLTESEPFSEYEGGAISRWVANVLRFEDTGVVIAPSADDSWGFGTSRVRTVPALVRHKAFLDQGGHHLPWLLRLRMLRRMLEPALADLKAGDVVWVHARPEFAKALQTFVRQRGASLYLHLHNSHLVQWSKRVTAAIDADCYVFNSSYLQQEALSKFPDLKRTSVLPNGADPDMFFPATAVRSPAALPVVLFASRLVPDKGLHVFLEAMRRLSEAQVPLQGIVVGGAAFGNTPPTAYVRTMQDTAPENVRFEPYCAGAQLAVHFRQADIYCLPAVWHDPFPLTVLEAMASGTPVVASRSGGIPEQLAAGGGILVARNSATELAEALSSLAIDPARRSALGAAGYASFHRQFTWDTIHAHYREILAFKAFATTVESKSMLSMVTA